MTTKNNINVWASLRDLVLQFMFITEEEEKIQEIIIKFMLWSYNHIFNFNPKCSTRKQIKFMLVCLLFVVCCYNKPK